MLLIDIQPLCLCINVEISCNVRQDTQYLFSFLLLNMTKVKVGSDNASARLSSKGGNRQPIFFMVHANDTNEVRNLIRQGTNVNIKNLNGSTPLHIACIRGNVEMIELLIKSGADVRALDNEGDTPLTKLQNDIFTMSCAISYIIDRGDDVNIIKDAEGDTFLHWACSHGYLDLVRKLVEHGAQLNVTNRRGQTPLDLAKDTRRDTIVNYLQSISAPNDRRRYRVSPSNALTAHARGISTSNRFNYFKLMKFGIEMEILHNFMLNQSTEYERNRTFSIALNNYRNHLISINRQDNEYLDRKYYHVLATSGYRRSPFPDNTIPQLPRWYKGSWVIEHDVTVVRDNANNSNYNEYTEIVSPPMSVYKKDKKYYNCSDFGPTVLKNMVGKLFPNALLNNNIISVKYKNNQKCSMHTHISCIDNTGDNKLKQPNNLAAVCLYWKLFEDVFMGLIRPFRHLESNRRFFQDTAGLFPHQVEDNMTISRIVELTNGGINNKHLNIRHHRYRTLNLQNLVEGHGTIEVRIHHGSFNPQEMNYWVFALTLFFNYAMSEGYRKGARQVANEVSQLKNSLTNYQLRFEYLFNKIVKSSFLGTVYMHVHNYYYPGTRITYDASGYEEIEDDEVLWIINLIKKQSFWSN